MKKNQQFNHFLGEFIGTFILILFGTGSVAVTVLFSAHQGLFQIAIIWGLAVTLAIYMTRHLSNAHFNPAVTFAMALTGRLEKNKILTYLCGQILGAFSASMLIYYLFAPSIAAFEKANNIVRGSFESVATAKMFGEYYIQPGSSAVVSMPLAIGVEFVGTFLLVLMIFLFTEKANTGRPNDNSAPVFIGLTVASIIALLAPLTQAGLNPVRDFVPRLVTLIFGWGEWSFPDASGGAFWVYILAPILAGLCAGLVFTKIIEPNMKK